jgi:hypothetical protein
VAELSGYGISAALPGGFEGRIFRRPAGVAAGSATRAAELDRTVLEQAALERTALEQTLSVAHFATFALPPEVADFGGGAVTLMGPSDLFTVLFEYGSESVGRALFARDGMPRSLRAEDFRPYLLRRGLGGQSGTQWFFTESGRPFTLYAVLGSHARRYSLVPTLNRLLDGIRIAATVPS